MTLKNVMLGFLAVVLVLVGYAVHAGIAIISVHSPNENLWIPVPVALGHVVGKFIDLPIPKQGEIETLMEYRAVAADLLRQLHDLPDCSLVEVDSRNEKVRVFKQGDNLCVNVDDHNEHVKVRLPLRTVDRFVEALDKEHLTVGDLVACLEWQPSGDLVHVKSDNEEVRISIW
jgi:hypothetical protein